MKIEEISLKIRQEVLKMAVHANGGHIAPALSAADVITVLYFDNVLRYDAKNPNWNERDFFILSKGHACLALYSALARANFFPKEILKNFMQKDSILGGHPDMNKIPGVEASTGALGHGLLFAIGIAIANKMSKCPGQVYVMVGDGECEEGSIWEGVMSAVYHKLDNLVVIVDHNKFQAMDSLESIMGLHDLGKKFEAFGFSASEIDGHNHFEIRQALTERVTDKPRVVIANTVKGKGISFMEGQPLWHCRMPNDKELKIALKDLHMTEAELNEL